MSVQLVSLLFGPHVNPPSHVKRKMVFQDPSVSSVHMGAEHTHSRIVTHTPFTVNK